MNNINKKKPFIKEDEIFNLFEVLGYTNIIKNECIFTYEHKGKWADKFRIDHAFTNNPGRVKMEYIDMIEHGFNHKDMLIEVDI